MQRILPIIHLKLQLKSSTQVMYKTRVDETYITRPWELLPYCWTWGVRKAQAPHF
ncbi:hypothetical protein KSP40_PGU001767 [Platanthera guangdongensis]|uniref:Uncharacterized protein n=1 Tax=Platanthera guangdongensis TaxID=2320717 RepID=A0ABR2M1R3_9ASPA